MPPDQGMLRVIAEIRALQAARVEARLGEATSDMTWRELPSGTQDDFLARNVDWTDFSPDQRSDVIRRVIEGEPHAEWMDGVIIDQHIKEWETRWEARKAPEYPEGEDALFREMRGDYAARAERRLRRPR